MRCPRACLRERLALRAAEACVAQSGRPERAGELRDAVHLLRAGDLPGPAGESYLAWRRAVEQPVSIKALYRALPGIEAGTDRRVVGCGAGRASHSCRDGVGDRTDADTATGGAGVDPGGCHVGPSARLENTLCLCRLRA